MSQVTKKKCSLLVKLVLPGTETLWLPLALGIYLFHVLCSTPDLQDHDHSRPPILLAGHPISVPGLNSYPWPLSLSSPVRAGIPGSLGVFPLAFLSSIACLV